MKPMHYVRAFNGIVWREFLRFLQQRERFFAALVRPLIWLIIFAAGFRAALGISIIPPYQTYITYDVYITPGLLGMIQLFNGMQTSLSMVYDREMGSMRVLLTTPLPRWFLLVSRLFAGVVVSLFQVYVFLLVAYFCGVELPPWGYLTALPALILTGMMFGALGMHLQPVHLCGRTDPLRPLSRSELAGACRGGRLPAGIPRVVGVGVRSVLRHPAAKGRRRRRLKLSRWRNLPDSA